MSEAAKLAKAQLRELQANGQETESKDHNLTVQFNPDTLKVSYSNQVVPPNNNTGGDQRGTAATQVTGKGTTKLSVQLVFDVTGVLPQDNAHVNDVRTLTHKVVYFITPKADATPPVPPGVRFLWGSFQFDGLLESVEETLEFFSADGKPLRATVALGLTQQDIYFQAPQAGGNPGAASPGRQPLTQAKLGDTLQGLADRIGMGGNWQAIASANGIENPRLLQPGQVLNLNASLNLRVGSNE